MQIKMTFRQALVLGMGVVALAVGVSLGCSPAAGGGAACDPTKLLDCGASDDVCDAATKKCVTPKACTTADDCTGAYKCGLLTKRCLASCGVPGDEDLVSCKSGSTCSADRQCVAKMVAMGDMAVAGAEDMAPPVVNDCNSYCTIIMARCFGGVNDQYPDRATCFKVCSADAWAAGSLSDASGNTLGCRINHAQLAAGNPATHCPHAGPTGDGICGTLCQNLCAYAAKNCTGNNAAFTDDADCASKCAAFATSGKLGDETGDTVQCRLTYAINATGLVAAGPNCPNLKALADNPSGQCK